MKHLVLFHLTVLFFTVSNLFNPVQAQVIINEYSCANLKQFVDDHSDYEDWVEFYNTSDTTVDLSNWFFSDQPDEPNKWQFPAGTTIAGKDFLLVWCSGRNVSTPNGTHTNFKLTQTKNNPETLTLTGPDGLTASSTKINKTQVSMSRGRTEDGATTWGIYAQPTPKSSNNDKPWYTSYADRPSFDLEPGRYAGPQVVTITNNELNSKVYYTTDGSAPTASSTLYTDPITIAQTTVLKAVCISTNPRIHPSFIEFNTYFIDDKHTIPVISVSGFELDVLANGQQDLRPVGSIEYFDVNGQRVASSYGEFNSHGQDSWVNDQRSIDLVCRDEMGYSKGLKEKIFQRSTRDEFQRLIMRAGGDDNYPDGSNTPGGGAHMRDAYVHNLADRAGLNLDLRRSEKAIVYINGVYWGVYDLRELPDDHDYTEYYHNQGKFEIQYLLTWGNTWAEYGGDQALADWQSLRQYINSHNMTNQAYFNYVDERIDLKSLVDYIIVNSVTVCSDWLNYNTGWWRGFNPEGSRQKWSYILWDNDATFGYYINYTGIADTSAYAEPCQVEDLTSQWPDLNGHMRTLNKLRQNAEFNRYYKSRYIDLMNTVFSCDNMLTYMDSIYNVIKPEMGRHINRWGGTMQGWEDNVARLRYFIERRCVEMNNGLNSCYDLSGPFEVTFDADPALAAQGLKVNSLTVNTLPYTGKYFEGIGIRTELLPDEVWLEANDMEFVNWTAGDSTFFTLSDSLLLTMVNIKEVDTIVAHFAKITSSVSTLPSGVKEPTLSAAPTVFHGTTTITLDLPQSQPVALRMVSTSGRIVANLADQSRALSTGRHTFVVSLPEQLPPGLYLVQLQTAQGQLQTLKLIRQ